MKHILIIITALLILQAARSYANPTQSGSTGLITVPTADTLLPGNVCVGVWGDLSAANDKHAVIMPVGVTIGLGASWEAYGSYPNIMFNDQEERAGKGWAELGTKIRFHGKSNSKFKLAADLFGQRTVSGVRQYDGLTNYGGRLIASLYASPFGLHAFSGYRVMGSPPGKSYDNEILYGAGIDLLATPRTKMIFELLGNTSNDPAIEDPLEGSVGVQYYISPHLTINLAGTAGITAGSPDWRAIFGFSTCQGVGTYVKPIPSVRKPGEKQHEQVVKPVKIIPLTPLLMNAAVPAAPVSNLEVHVEADQEDIYVRPSAQVVIPVAQTPTTSSVTLPPLGGGAAVPEKREETAVAEKRKEKPAPLPSQPAPEEVLKDGESPLYSIDVKGDKFSIGAAKTAGKDTMMHAYRKFRFPDVVHEYNQTEISQDVRKSLSEVADLLRNDKKWKFIRIDAHTDGLGSSNYNMDLSLKRAIAIASFLATNEGIDPARILVKGMGKSRLIADNATKEGRQANRRFEILLLAPKGLQ